MINDISTLIAAFSALLAAVFGFVQFRITKKYEREDKKEEHDNETKKALEEMREEFREGLADIKEEQNKSLAEIRAEQQHLKTENAKQYALLQRANGAISNSLEEYKATTWRNHILRFADEISDQVHKTYHSPDYWRQILDTCDKYVNFCENHDHYINGVADDSIKLIRKIHYKLLQEGKL